MNILSITALVVIAFECKAVPTDVSLSAQESTTLATEVPEIGYITANKNSVKCPPGGCIGGGGGGGNSGAGSGTIGGGEAAAVGGGIGISGSGATVGGGSLISSLVILVIKILAQVLNAVVIIVQSLLGLEGVNALLGNVLCNTLPGVLAVVTNLINIIGATLNGLTG